MSECWPGAAHAFPVDRLDAFLCWANERGAADVCFQTGAPAFIEVDGALAQATEAVLDAVVLDQLVAVIFNTMGKGILQSGEAIDCSHAVQVERNRYLRFRCNIAPVQVAGGEGINISIRVLPGTPPTLERYGVEAEIIEAWDRCRGLTLVTGVPGSGKSTLLAAGTRRLLERGAGRIQSFEAPIEFVFDDIEASEALMSSAEVPRHFRSFAEGLRSSLRRRPAAVVVGEARDRETVEAVVRAADFGIAVYSTTHTIGVAATVRRMLAEFPPDERAERGAAIIDVLNLVVTQVLVRKPGGGRTALREWLVFDAGLKAALLEAAQPRWAQLIQAALERTGHTLAAAARAAYAGGAMSERERRRWAGPGEPQVGPGQAGERQ